MSSEYTNEDDHAKAWREMVNTSQNWINEPGTTLHEDLVIVWVDEALKRAEYVRKQQLILIKRREASIKHLKAELRRLKK